MSEYVKIEALRGLSDEELVRSLNEDAMPSELFIAMRREYRARRIDGMLAELKETLEGLHKATYSYIREHLEEDPMKKATALAPISVGYDTAFHLVHRLKEVDIR